MKPESSSTPPPPVADAKERSKLNPVRWIRSEAHSELNSVESAVLLLIRIVLVLGVLYLFLVSIGMMGAGFKIFGKDFAKALIQTTNNPFVGLFVGIFATALIQSSSTTTSMVVAFVAAGTISVENAVPVIMGANIGTAVTSTLVSLGHVARKRAFERAFAAGTVHDLFNLMAVVVFLPLELSTRYLSRSAATLSGLLAGTGGLEFKSPLKVVTQPASQLIINGISALGFGKVTTGVIIVALSFLLLIFSLIFLTKLLKVLVFGKLQRFFEESMYSSGYIAILIGVLFTALVQSSSVTTSLMIPLAAAGIMTVEQVYPVALGANVGTTVTALLAALATGRPEALTIALVHLLFNLSGIALFFPIPALRRIPIRAARFLASIVTKNRFYGVIFILILYFLLPGLAILAT